MAEALDEVSRASSRLALADVRWARGAHEEARELARQALAETAERPGAMAEARAEIEAWLLSHAAR